MKRNKLLEIRVAPPKPYPWWLNSKYYVKSSFVGAPPRTEYSTAKHARTWARRNAKLARGEFVLTKTKREEILKRKKARERYEVALEAHELQELCRKKVAAGVERLGKIIESPVSQDQLAIAAFNALCDRGYGRASQTNITARVTTDAIKNLDQKALDERIGETLRRVEELTGGEKKKAARPKQPIDIRKYN